MENVDPFDPNTLDFNRTCRIYDADLERFAIVDEKYYSALVTRRDTNPHRNGKIQARSWNVKDPHPSRNGKKRYFVSSSGWRQGEGTFLHVEVMRLSGRLPPTKRHVLVGHIDGDEWNCTEDNLEWSTHVRNRRQSKQKYNKPIAP